MIRTSRLGPCLLLALALSAPVAAQSSSTITYQGRLTENGVPASGEYDVRFILYDAEIGGSQVGSIVSAENQLISDGLFTMELNFGPGAFNGDERHLEIAVRDGNSTGGYDVLDPRQRITPAPYAIHSFGTADHDHWGETWTGSGDGPTLASLTGYDLRLGGTTGSLVANSGNYSDLALISNDNVTIQLDADGGGSSDFHILAGDNSELFSVAEDGEISWQTQTGYLSVSAAAFRPVYGGYDFNSPGQSLVNVDDISDYYRAPVFLPHGATVTRLSFYYSDSSAATGILELRRNNMTGSYSQMAYVETENASNVGHDDTISINEIDNSQFSYFLICNLPDSDFQAWGAIIEYTYTTPH